MIADFDILTADEKKLIYKVPALVTVLIAGADGEIEEKELQEAVEITKRKQSTGRKDLIQYYEEISKTFESDLQKLIDSLPTDSEERSNAVIAELEKLNAVLPKIEKSLAVKFHASIKDLAKKVAESSGGVLGYLAVGFEEAQLIGLDMINDPAS